MSAGHAEAQWGRFFIAAQTIMDFAVEMGAVRTASSLTVRELLDEFQTAKAKTGRSKRYLRQVRVSVKGGCWTRAWSGG